MYQSPSGSFAHRSGYRRSRRCRRRRSWELPVLQRPSNPVRRRARSRYRKGIFEEVGQWSLEDELEAASSPLAIGEVPARSRGLRTSPSEGRYSLVGGRLPAKRRRSRSCQCYNRQKSDSARRSSIIDTRCPSPGPRILDQPALDRLPKVEPSRQVLILPSSRCEYADAGSSSTTCPRPGPVEALCDDHCQRGCDLRMSQWSQVHNRRNFE